MASNETSGGLPAAGFRTGPFVGRGAELARLIRALEHAQAGRVLESRFVLVGRPGVGKTRLLEEAMRYAIWRGLRVVEAGWTPSPRGLGASGLWARERGFGHERGAARATLVAFDPVEGRSDAILARRRAQAVASANVTIATARDGVIARAAGFAAPETIELTGLDETDGVALLRALTGPAFEAHWARRVVRVTAGYPASLERAAELRRHVICGDAGPRS